MHSWKMYENYTGPLGAGTLTAIAGDHYGPSVESSERNGWGQWHRADSNGIGMDRTVATGTGFVGQYQPAVAQIYESLAECPDELLLFFHHVPYTYTQHSGKTVIQHIYDSHYDGAAMAEANVARWKSLNGRIDPPVYTAVLARLEYQAGAAQVWRDAICSWFLKTSGIPDEQRRAGHFPGRVEAESMKLDGYRAIDVDPWESASGGKAVECARTSGACSAQTVFDGKSGKYDIDVEYFDQNGGVAKFTLSIDGRTVSAWLSDDNLPGNKIDGSSSVRHRLAGVSLKPGDTIRIEGTPAGSDKAALDYIEFRPSTSETVGKPAD
jgi:alpha-glucuronidase